jgi:hypothetical protein
MAEPRLGRGTYPFYRKFDAVLPTDLHLRSLPQVLASFEDVHWFTPGSRGGARF